MLAIAAVLTLSACGGSSGSSKSAYVGKADAICRAARTQTTPLISEVTSEAGSVISGSSSARARLTGTLQRLHTLVAGSLAQLQRLRQPSGDRAAIGAFLSPLGQVVHLIGQAANAVGSGQMAAALALFQQGSPVAQRAATAAQSYGMQQCGSVLAGVLG